jgi:hypothetical protein
VEESWQHPQPKDETACQDSEVNKNQLARHKMVCFMSLVTSFCFDIPLSWIINNQLWSGLSIISSTS